MEQAAPQDPGSRDPAEADKEIVLLLDRGSPALAGWAQGLADLKPEDLQLGEGLGGPDAERRPRAPHACHGGACRTRSTDEL